MLIKFTAEERRHIKEIQDSYAEERAQLEAAMAAEENEVEHHKLRIKFQACIENMERELDAYSDQCQRKRFAKISGGKAGIIAHAKKQAPAILKEIQKDYASREYSIDDLKRLGILKEHDGQLCVNANLAAFRLKEELKLHIEALADDKAASQELLEAFIEAVENSPYTDNSEITDSAKQPVEVLRYRRSPLAEITAFGLMNDNANAQLIQEDGIFSETADGQITIQWRVNEGLKDSKPVATYIGLTYDGSGIKTTKKMTGYDQAIYDAIGTRIYHWNIDNQQKPLYLTPQEIWRTMNGKRSGDGSAKPSKAQVKRICDSLDKMRFTRIYMDISEEAQAYNYTYDDERIINGHIDTYLLNCSKAEFVTDKGNTVTGYRIAEEPILYSYNKAKHRILTVPYEMLDTSQTIGDSENVTEFKNYLLQQIQLMKNAADDSAGKRFKRKNKILLETIYKATGIEPPEQRAKAKAFTSDTARQTYIRKTRKADREKIEGLLSAWKAKGWITDFAVLNSKDEPVRKKQQAKGFRIIL